MAPVSLTALINPVCPTLITLSHPSYFPGTLATRATSTAEKSYFAKSDEVDIDFDDNGAADDARVGPISGCANVGRKNAGEMRFEVWRDWRAEEMPWYARRSLRIEMNRWPKSGFDVVENREVGFGG